MAQPTEDERLPARPAPAWTLKATQLLGAAAFACIAKFMPVYFAHIGLERNVIGILSFCGMGITFVGQQFWSILIDWLGDFKSVLVATQIAATSTLFFYTLKVVQENTILVFCVAITNTFLASTGGTIIDAMCMSTLKKWSERAEIQQRNQYVTPRTKAGSQISYGETRLWSAVGWGGMSLLMGVLIDAFGLPAMFAGFAVIQATNVLIVVYFMPNPEKKPATEFADAPAPATGGKFKKVCTFNAVLFFTNLMIYGICMCLIENFLFIYLVQDFDGVSTFLLGASTTVMCIFEIPIFACVGPWLERQPKGNDTAFTAVLLICQIITAVRCVLYAIMPSSMAWLVLVIGCLQGVSFAAMWTASMEYAKRLATDDTLATMTSLTGGIYYSLSMGFGSLIWGQLVLKPQDGGMGFRSSFWLDAEMMMVWSVLWLFMTCVCTKKQTDAAAPLTNG